MSIETLQDWNTRLGYCGCCPMPVCPSPVADFEQKLATVCGFRYPFYHPAIEEADKARFFRTANEARRYDENFTYPSTQAYKATTVTGTHTKNTERISVKEKVSGACVISHITESNQLEYHLSETADDPAEWEEDEQIPWNLTDDIVSAYLKVDGVVDINSGTRTIYSAWSEPTTTVDPYIVGFPPYNFFNLSLNSWDYEPFATRFTLQPGIFGETPTTLWSVEFSDEILPAEIDAEVDAADWVSAGSAAKAQRFNGSTPTDNIYRKVRFRFRIPHTHTGSKFWITYDIAEFPEDGAPSFFSEVNVVEWTGPGTGASSDPSWLTPWAEIAPPEVPGERRIVNIRYTCYTGTRYGVKPQVMGEAFTPPPP